MDVKTEEANRSAHRHMAEQAAEFNAKIVGYPIPDKPQLMSEDRASFRADFMQEELDEFRKAQAEGDLDGAVDAVIDLMYVACGAMNEMGVVTMPCYDEVHKANMAKRRGGLSKRPGSKGFDAVKPEGWKAPSHADYLTITSEDVQTILAIRRGEAKVHLVTAEDRRKAQQDAQLELFKSESIGVDSVVHYHGPDDATRINGRLATVQEREGKRITIAFIDPRLPQQMDVSLRELTTVSEALVDEAISRDALTALLGPEQRMKVMVLGYARHGKDTVCELLSKTGARFTSSSWFCAERIAFPALKDKYGYADVQACFDDRHNHRAEWYDLITTFNTPDLTRLGRAIFEEHDVYCGIRNARELHALKNAGIYDVAIWVDASERVKSVEDRSSCTVEPWMADFVLDNNGTVEDLQRNLESLMGTLRSIAEG